VPLWGLPFCMLDASPDALRPWLGGRLELDGVLGGSPSLASSRASRSFNFAFSAIRSFTLDQRQDQRVLRRAVEKLEVGRLNHSSFESQQTRFGNPPPPT
jgi:hypothetical protein